MNDLQYFKMLHGSCILLFSVTALANYNVKIPRLNGNKPGKSPPLNSAGQKIINGV